MLLIREVFHCKPGKVRPMIEKFLAMGKLTEKAGWGKGRVLTDFAGERYWTIISEYEVPSLRDFEEMMSGKNMTEEMNQEFEKIMVGYHDLIDHGHREIYKVEG